LSPSIVFYVVWSTSSWCCSQISYWSWKTDCSSTHYR